MLAYLCREIQNTHNMKKLILLAMAFTMTSGLFAQDLKTQLINELKTANMYNVSELLGMDIDPTSDFGKAYSAFNDQGIANVEKRLMVVDKFANNFGNITPELANELIKESIAAMKERTKMMEKMPKTFGKYLSPSNLLSLMQYENKKQAIFDNFLARNIPFANMK
jgi:hypothetical protein